MCKRKVPNCHFIRVRLSKVNHRLEHYSLHLWLNPTTFNFKTVDLSFEKNSTTQKGLSTGDNQASGE